MKLLFLDYSEDIYLIVLQLELQNILKKLKSKKLSPVLY